MGGRVSGKAAFREYLEVLGAAALAALFVRSFVLGAYRISTDAMAPSLLAGDFVFASKLSYGFSLPFSSEARIGRRLPERGEIAVLRSPLDENASLAKRVAALAGDAVRISKSGQIFVNDAPVSWLPPITRRPEAPEIGPIVVPPGQVFVLNENVDASDATLPWGSVPERYLEGRVVFVWMSLDWQSARASGSRWPLIRWKRIGFAPSP